jgi:hypothetical protein
MSEESHKDQVLATSLLLARRHRPATLRAEVRHAAFVVSFRAHRD